MSNAPDLPYAKFSQRLGASLIDSAASLFLVGIFLFVVIRPRLLAMYMGSGFAHSGGVRARWDATGALPKAEIFLMFLLSAFFPPVLYYALLESSVRRATLGKMALDLVTVRIDGSRVSFLRAAARHILRRLFGFVPFGFTAALPVFGERRQGLHDMATGVVVMRRGDAAV